MTLVDFQIVNDSTGDEPGVLAFQEVMRAWIKGARLEAPFRSLVVVLSADAAAHGAEKARGVCRAHLHVEPETLKVGGHDAGWIAARVLEALSSVETLGWKSATVFADQVRSVGRGGWPATVALEAFRRKRGRAGGECVPWLSLAPDEMRLGVDLGHGEVLLVARDEPARLEDVWPVTKASVIDGHYTLATSSGEVVASVGLYERGLGGELSKAWRDALVSTGVVVEHVRGETYDGFVAEAHRRGLLRGAPMPVELPEEATYAWLLDRLLDVGGLSKRWRVVRHGFGTTPEANYAEVDGVVVLESVDGLRLEARADPLCVGGTHYDAAVVDRLLAALATELPKGEAFYTVGRDLPWEDPEYPSVYVWTVLDAKGATRLCDVGLDVRRVEHDAKTSEDAS
ncbi:MAG: hypothetical protein H6720_17080 [Sandaracinus sp.]|nr:hypothetical protein [Sandaracinus sp.]